MRDFFKHTFATVLGLLIFLGLGTGGLILMVISATKDTEPQVKDKSVLVFDMSVRIKDTNPSSGTGELIQKAVSGQDNDETIALRTVLDAIEAATKDKRIVAIYLDACGETAGKVAGFATLKEVRRALERFKAAGKKIIAYNVDWDEPTYYLGSVADTIVVNPMGIMEMNGLRSETMFLAGALEKYGIGVQVIRVGKYKSAVEPFLVKQMSPENRAQVQRLLEDIWGEFRVSVGKSRKLTPQQVQAIADNQGLLQPEQARKSRLVDKVAYFDEVVADLKQLTGNDKNDKFFRQIRLSTYAKVAEKSVLQKRQSENKIAVVYAEGEIVTGEGSIRQVGGDRLARQLRRIRLDNDVKAVVLRVNSPGGSATASEVIQREVRLTRKQKPVVVSMGDVAASGGYWISTYANRIFAEPNTITGSIGVFGLLMNVQKLANDNGITWDVVKTGRYADAQTISRPKTAQELAIYQGSVNHIYYQFVAKVAESRQLPQNKVQEIAQGRVWSGLAAKKIGLVDNIGGIDSAINYAAKIAKLGNDWELEQYSNSRSLEERLLKNLLSSTNITSENANKAFQFDPLTITYERLREDLSILGSMNDPLDVYARLPFNLRID
ncbi:signal peptide peptidase SppA [Argonema antarcticum]|uniref:signal peptide peptidase SppA n=1 Tax=Argonema antarcticum TaxID=2942763 RepID=UPI00201390CF|nr:signal peptide peptidase SppA [Argonema antarcticum]MCL1471338.1 signal peptide peptidase SppA [Argonema antarcticum A004/B2]